MYDCQTCGACCVEPFGLDKFVYLSPAESERLARIGLPVLTRKGADFLGTRPHDGLAAGAVCAAFGGTVGGACQCTVYGQRPAECRRFEVGSFKCRVARQAAGLLGDESVFTADAGREG